MAFQQDLLELTAVWNWGKGSAFFFLSYLCPFSYVFPFSSFFHFPTIFHFPTFFHFPLSFSIVFSSIFSGSPLRLFFFLPFYPFFLNFPNFFSEGMSSQRQSPLVTLTLSEYSFCYEGISGILRLDMNVKCYLQKPHSSDSQTRWVPHLAFQWFQYPWKFVKAESYHSLTFQNPKWWRVLI